MTGLRLSDGKCVKIGMIKYSAYAQVASLRGIGVIMTLSLLVIEGDRECQTRIAVRSTVGVGRDIV
jgi:hypothetical protein